MQQLDIGKLQAFLGSEVMNSGCSLYLPRFLGEVKLTPDPSTISPLEYAGGTFSERDAKAALYVTSILGHVLETDKIHLEEASGFAPVAGFPHKTAFLFGSRSNKVTRWATENLPTRKFFSFEFGAHWKIKCEDGSVFSTPDPSKLAKGLYASQTDYGVVSRLSHPASGEQVFVIAGLGSRATEGCGYYFSQHWQQLFQGYGENDFALVLKFKPPLDPRKCEPVAWFGSELTPFSFG
jgi:hypothetical protein